MALDPRFFCSSDLEGVFLDKLSGLPLAAGVIKFYSDVDRTVGKDVYMLSGNPPYNTASFVSLGDTITLNSVGGYQDGLGNSIVIYYFPFEGLPDTSPFTNVQELYYVEVFNSGGTQQFTREAWPPEATSSGGEDVLIEDATNYIPNGQFLPYNTPILTETSGALTLSLLAQGGWYFRKTTTGTGVYTLTFESTLQGATNLLDFPSNAIRISRGSLGTETVYELFVKWTDVNTFSRLINVLHPQRHFNLLSAIKSNGGFPETVNVFIVQNFGGSDTDHYISMPNISVSDDGNYNYYNTTIDFPDNSGTPILGDGSYVGIALRMPSTAFDLSFTDFALTITNTALTNFPVMSPDEVLSRAINGNFPVPNPDGSDLYLSLVLTPEGMTWDDSVIGEIRGKITNTAIKNELLCDGTKYKTSDYSTIGIPYARLFAKLFNSTTNGPVFGTGVDFVNVYQSSGLTNQIIINTNKGLLPQTAPADGAVATGFTFGVSENLPFGVSLAYQAFSNSTGLITALSLFTAAALLVPSAGTSGMTVTDYSYFGSTGTYKVIQIQALTAAALSTGAGIAGKYFNFSTNGVNYRMWFQVVGEIAPAAGGKTLIQCNLTSTMSARDVGEIIASVLTVEQTDVITIPAVPPAGSYFTFHANGVTYTPWYQVDGLPSTEPALLTNAIKVVVLSTDTSAQVAFKTQTAINSEYFAVPDLRGMFLRGVDSTGVLDIDYANRWSYYGQTVGGTVGTFEASQLISHLHSPISPATNFLTDGALFANPAAGASIGLVASTSLTGGVENRPYNMSVNWFIKY